MKTYQSLQEMQQDLKKLNLERQIALEELKLVKNEVSNQFKPVSLIGSFLKFAGKYGLLVLVRKILK